METFIQALLQPGRWNSTQWLAVCIGLFVLLASLYLVIRLYRVIRDAGKSSYRPNIGLGRAGLRDRGQGAGAARQGAGGRERERRGDEVAKKP